MASYTPFHLKICSYNMFGFSNGSSLLSSLSQSYDIILLQEHWLTTNNLNKLNDINPNFTSFAVSAMDKKTESSILNGRPFGGTAFLVNNNLLQYIKFVDSDSINGRY